MGINKELPLNVKNKLAFLTETLELSLEPWQKKLLVMYWQDEEKEKKRKDVDLFEKY
jgi:hypothetical protein